MAMVEVAECNSCGKREDALSGYGRSGYPPFGWVYLIRPLNLMGIITEDKYLVCSADCLNLAYHHCLQRGKKDKK